VSILTKLYTFFTRREPTAEDYEAKLEAQRIRDDFETAKLSQRSAAGESYQAFGGPGT
jgi:hypothetical protein